MNGDRLSNVGSSPAPTASSKSDTDANVVRLSRPAATSTSTAVTTDNGASGAPVSAASGDAGASGVDAQTNQVNSQIAGVVAGGGPVSVAATNANKVTVSDQGSGVAQTGASGAQNGSRLASGTPTAGPDRATAVSGDALALGVDAQNNVVNQSQIGVVVGGGNYGNIGVLSSNEATILNAGMAAANSGMAIAKVAPLAEGGGLALPLSTPIGTLTPNRLATPIARNINGDFSAQAGPIGTPGPIRLVRLQGVS
ncbi:MAG: hypothetical protein IT424_12850, partial [Pirellulales bacterium]|nr:hypothetical protein [Pirellulales bacterium]